MAKKLKKKRVKKIGPSKGLVYFSTRVLKRAVAKGTKSVASKAMALVGYTVKELDGWVVKEYKDGSIEKISKIEKASPNKLVLD